MTRKEKAGIMMADSLIEWAHMMYNHNTAKGVITFVIKQLQKRLDEYIPIKEVKNNVRKR